MRLFGDVNRHAVICIAVISKCAGSFYYSVNIKLFVLTFQIERILMKCEVEMSLCSNCYKYEKTLVFICYSIRVCNLACQNESELTWKKGDKSGMQEKNSSSRVM